MRGFYRFEQNKIDGYYINNEYVGRNIIIETTNYLNAIKIMQTVTMDYSHDKGRWNKSPSEFSVDLELMLDYIEDDAHTIVYHKQGKKAVYN